MKATIKILMSTVMVVALASCAKHDLFDENTITGKVGPEAYWEPASAAVTAGTNMDFAAQYYSTSQEIDHSEVWYDIMETIEQNVLCPWTATFSFSQSSIVTSRKRISQKIQEYPHLKEYWNDSVSAFVLESSFPVSGTLAPFAWKQPVQFDSAQMVKYFGDTYMAEFKEHVHEKMQFEDYRKMYLGLGLVDDFKQFSDSTFDKNQNKYVYHFPKDAETQKEVIPDTIVTIWNELPFDQLINNAANGYYEVEYKRSYYINAILRVYDARGVYGKTESKKIDIN